MLYGSVRDRNVKRNSKEVKGGKLNCLRKEKL